jgi:CysZ protein
MFRFPLRQPDVVTMLTALFRAINQLSDPKVRRVVWLGIFGAAAAFAGLAAVVWTLLFETDLIPWHWLDTAVDVLGGLAVFGLAWLLFPAVVVAVSGLLLDSVVEAVERRWYPSLPPGREQPIVEMIFGVLRFFLVVAALNLIALPVYLFLPAINLAVFYVLNGYLLSREYYELVAFRRLDPARARQVRRAYSGRLFAAGVIIAFFSTIPFVNLIVPVVGTAFMVHVFYGLPGSLRPDNT